MSKRHREKNVAPETPKAKSPKQFFKFVELQTPPFSLEARTHTGQLLRLLQEGETPAGPQWKPMTKSIGAGCSELRVRDGQIWWRIVCFVDEDWLVVLEVFPKKTEETPKDVKDTCQKRLTAFLKARSGS